MMVLLSLAACGGGGGAGGDRHGDGGEGGTGGDNAVDGSGGATVGGESPANEPDAPSLGTANPDGPAPDIYDDLAARAAARYTGSREQATLDTASIPVFVGALTSGVDAFADGPDLVGETRAVERLPALSLGTERHLFGEIDEIVRTIGLFAASVESGRRDCTSGHVDVDRIEDDAGAWHEVVLAFDGCSGPARPVLPDPFDFDSPGLFPGAGDRAPSFDGVLTLRRAATADGTGTLQVGYDDLTARAADRVVTVVGAERWQGNTSCTGDRTRTSHLLIEDGTGSGQVLLDGLRSTSELDGSAERCGGFASTEVNRFDGSILHAVHGRADVATVRSIGFRRSSSTSSDAAAAPALESAGELSFVGRGGKEIRLRYAWLRPGRMTEEGYGFVGRDRRVVLLERVSASGPEELLRLSMEDLLAGAASDLGDADGDALPNAWERRHGLDPDTPDAALDPDADGLSSREEFAQLSAPRDGDDHGPRTDAGIDVTLEEAREDLYPFPEEDSLVTRVIVELNAGSSALVPTTWRFTVRLDGAGAWSPYDVPYGCERDERDARLLRCARENRSLHGESDIHLSFTSASEGEVRVVAELDAGALDTYPPNDRRELSHSITAPDVDFALEASGLAIGNERDTRTLVAELRQLATTLAVDVELVASVPPGVEVSRATLSSDGRQAVKDRCTVAATVTCAMELVRRSDTLGLELDYRVAPGTDDVIVWQVLSAKDDTDATNETPSTRVRHVASSAPLQAMLDAASDGQRVVLPAGEYVGSLDAGGKRLEIRGAAGNRRTALYTDHPDDFALVDPGASSLIADIDFRIAGHAIRFDGVDGLTVAGNRFEPPPELSRTGGDLMQGDGSYRFVGNVVRGFRDGGNANRRDDRFAFPDGSRNERCSRLLGLGARVAVDIRRNLVVDNRCARAIDLAGDYGRRTYGRARRATIANNTFVDDTVTFGLGDYGDISHSILIANNVIVRSATPLGPEEALDYVDFRDGGGLTTSRNLLFDSERESLLTGAMANRDGFAHEQLDVSFDPQFAADTDFRLSEGSPAIDQGVLVPPVAGADGSDAGDGAYPDGAVEPRDGLRDGGAEADLGAFEYRP